MGVDVDLDGGVDLGGGPILTVASPLPRVVVGADQIAIPRIMVGIDQLALPTIQVGLDALRVGIAELPPIRPPSS